jgi:DNA modification methylase
LLQNKHQRELPLEFNGSDIRFSEVLVEHFLADFTREGDIVFDPFAGFGTTVHVAESMNRIGFGVEVDRAKSKPTEQSYSWRCAPISIFCVATF